MQVLQSLIIWDSFICFSNSCSLATNDHFSLGSLVCGGLISEMYDCMFMGSAKIIIYDFFGGNWKTFVGTKLSYA
jgi:hypothetical protein